MDGRISAEAFGHIRPAPLELSAYDLVVIRTALEVAMRSSPYPEIAGTYGATHAKVHAALASPIVTIDLLTA